MKVKASTQGSEAEHIRNLVLVRTLRRFALSVEQSRAVTVVVSGPSRAMKSTLLKLDAARVAADAAWCHSCHAPVVAWQRTVIHTAETTV